MTQHLWRFGDFELDSVEHVLKRRGEPVRLRPQAFRALVSLVGREGSLVTRDELRAAIWPGEVVVDFEHGLNACIRQIRTVLRDNAEHPSFVETVPRVGYRFIAHVETVSRAATSRAATVRQPTPSPSSPGRDQGSGALLRAGAMAALGVAILATVLGVGQYALAVRSDQRETEELYVRARMLLDGWTAAGARTALELLEQIVAKDPAHSAAHASLAQAYLLRPFGMSGLDPSAALPRGQRAVERALALDGHEPEAHAALACLRLRLRDWPGAGAALHRARELAPTSARIRLQIAEWLALQQRFDEALAEARAAEMLDPLSPRARHEIASISRYARRYDEAILHARRTLELDPNFGPAHYTLGHAYLAKGDHESAIAAFTRSGGPTGNLGHALGIAGRTAAARDVLRSLQHRYAATRIGEGEIAQVLIGLREYDDAFEWLTRAVEHGNGFTLFTAAVWDPLREDPRFAELLVQAGFSVAGAAKTDVVTNGAAVFQVISDDRLPDR
jgi:DNA-binding winged helix-turn-helix (wHTH) protein/tetratricopeptide (TPR) repeat protein